MFNNYSHTVTLGGTEMTLSHEENRTVLRAFNGNPQSDIVLQIRGVPECLSLGVGQDDTDLSYMAILVKDSGVLKLGIVINHPQDGSCHYQDNILPEQTCDGKVPEKSLSVTYDDAQDHAVVTVAGTGELVATLYKLTGRSV